MSKKTLLDGRGATLKQRRSTANFIEINTSTEKSFFASDPNLRRKTMEAPNSRNGVSVRAYRGDAMTLLAFDLDESKTKNLTGFSVRVTPGIRKPYYFTNLLTYSAAILKKNNIKLEAAHSTFFSPIQKFRWVHVPATFHQIQEPFYGTYKYEVTPRYMVDEIIQPLDRSLTLN